MRAVAVLSIAVFGSVACDATLVEDPNGGGGGATGEGGEDTGGGGAGKQFPEDPPSYDLAYYQWVGIASETARTGAIVGLEDGSFANVYLTEGSTTPRWSFGSDLEWSAPEAIPGLTLQSPDVYLQLFEDRGTLTFFALGLNGPGLVAVGSRSEMTVTATPTNIREVTQHPDGSVYGLSIDTSAAQSQVSLVHWVDGVEEPASFDVAPVAAGCDVREGKIAFTASGDLVVALRCGPAEQGEWRTSAYRSGSWQEVQSVEAYRFELAPHDATRPVVGAYVDPGVTFDELQFAEDALNLDVLAKGTLDQPIYTAGFVDPWGRPIYTQPEGLTPDAVFVSNDEGATWVSLQLVGDLPDISFATAAFQRTTGLPVFSTGNGVYVYQKTPQSP